jgi:hypothetical protein
MIAAGCAKPPVEEMDAALSAVTRAENDPDAAAYAGNTLIRARDALASMRTAAEAKQYDSARTYAAEAVNAAEKAVTDGRAAAERAREEVAALTALLPEAFAETDRAVKAAEGKNIDLAAISRDLEAARRMMDQAVVAEAGGNYREALEKGQAARSALGDIRAKLSAAAMAVSRKK